MVPAGRNLIGTVRAAIEGGARAVVLRERDLPAAARAMLADQVQALLLPVGGALILASAAPPGWSFPLAGRHLRRTEELPVKRPTWLGRSTHSADELLKAASEDCDYVTLSPVALTRSKIGYGPPLGVTGFGSMLTDASLDKALPAVFALGGVDQDNAGSFLEAGAHGVAVMGPVMRSDNPAQTVADLLTQIPTETASTLTAS
jgi:thiamine-phosphate pyrophosphorylase